MSVYENTFENLKPSDFEPQFRSVHTPRKEKLLLQIISIGGTQNPSIRPSELRARQKFALREKSFLGAVLDIAYDA